MKYKNNTCRSIIYIGIVWYCFFLRMVELKSKFPIVEKLKLLKIKFP